MPADDSKLTANTKIPLGNTLAIIVTLLGTTWVLASKLTGIESRLASLETIASPDLQKRLAQLEAQVEVLVKDTYTAADHDDWAAQLQLDNPSLKVSRRQRRN